MRASEFLTNFIFETPDEVRSKIFQKVNLISDEDDLKNILQYSNQYTFKKDVGNLSSVKGYKDVVSGIILQTVGKLDEPSEKIKDFLNKLATDGIVKEGELLKTGKLIDMNQVIDSKYLNIFNKIKLDLFEKISGKIGEKGDVGKGEYLLSILSPKISRRGAPGDLNISGSNVELKAGTSGRLGPAGSQALAGRFDEYISTLQSMNLLQKGAEDYYLENILHFNLAVDMSRFSSMFENDNAKIKKALSVLLKMHYPTENTDKIADSIVSSGQINTNELKKQMLATSFKVYQSAKNFDGVLLSDYGLNKYIYINTPDSAAEISNFVSVKFPRWEDTQSNTLKIQIKASSRPDAETLPSAKSVPKSKIDKKKPTPDVQSNINKVDNTGDDDLNRLKKLANLDSPTLPRTSIKDPNEDELNVDPLDSAKLRSKRTISTK